MKPAETTPPSTRSGSPHRDGSQICPESPARTSSPTRLESAHAEQGHARMTLGFLEKVTFLSDKGFVALNGDNLDVPDLVAVANFGCGTSLLRDDIVGKVNDSIAVLKRKLSQEELVYGVNTGFGGSADVRTSKHVALQQGLVQLLNSGVLTNEDTMPASQASSLNGQSASMPTSWARGLMLARLNSIIRGHSAVSLEIIDTIVTFLQKDMTPVIPVRGSISASGDLIPLSYLAGCIQGSTDIYMRVGNLNSKVVPAAVALKEAGIQPIILGAKEGLGLLNGTAASVAVASLAIYESNQIALLSQILTAMGCEALKGTAESFHAFIAKTRPHKGQIEAASNILGFLSSSGLVSGFDGENKEVEGLAQDRYALRTSSQWIGPQLEDLMLATEQVTVELNSTTDNPLIDVEGDTILHGGNFQAASVTSAMEKTRLSVQMLAKMLFAQCTEIINPALNRGLPPNLCADDPSLSFTMKGVDISMAAYYSEIAFLSNPVSTHVQSAEMHNQALNSLALISARYTLQVVEIANMMCAAYLTMVCQALDLRVLQQRFIEALRPVIVVKTKSILEALIESSDSERSGQAIFVQVLKTWNSSTTMDLAERCDKTAEAASAILFSEMTGNSESEFKCSTQAVFSGIKTWKEELSTTVKELYEQTREEMFKDHKDITPRQLGQGSRKLYLFVRGELKIPFHRGLVEEPTHELGADQQASFPTAERRTIGSLIGIVYEAIRDGSIGKPLMEAVRENWK
ncbi:phenylalanine ammonia-lyase [Venturia nashicola]|nr:phenylalanine ammonia-lyase [Venturia nashicola]